MSIRPDKIPASFLIEKAILRYGLIIGAGFQLYQSLLGFLPGVPLETNVVNWSLTACLLACLFGIRKVELVQPIAALLHVAALSGFTFFWVHYGGLAGTVPSFFCFYVIFVIVVSHGVIRWLFLMLMGLLLIVFFVFPSSLGMTYFAENGKVDPVQLGVDYFIIAMIIVLFTLFMKDRFLFHRNRVIKRQQQLRNFAKTVEDQNTKLEAHHEEINVINENLEAIVEMRTLEIKEKNKSLSEYAFINAHMLRGPLCRIIGLLTLMEHENGRSDSEDLAAIKELAVSIDHKIKRINEVVS